MRYELQRINHQAQPHHQFLHCQPAHHHHTINKSIYQILGHELQKQYSLPQCITFVIS